ncbi:hypothetical protein BCR35DRAFT_308323 [Leucosporidium creatinivorum]|uniref:Uncharacterized protein n=1 Tax=Leucosporidium creatinivorum TaxID=106004 RepID=A0A1Y2E8S1_9BASI|nr:hypothetical protein BCR35DRAFT_308323 [Leucosporidium creatinivorum]
MPNNATAMVELIIAAVPEGGNLFNVLKETLYIRIFPVIPGGPFEIQLYVFAGIFAIDALLLLASLGVRLSQRQFKVFSWTPAVGGGPGSYITPNFADAWQLTTLVFLGCLEGFVARCLSHTAGSLKPGYTSMITLAYLPSWISAWLACWSLSVAHALSSRPHNPRWFNNPRFLNYHFVVGAVLFTIIIIVLASITSSFYDSMLHDFGVVEKALGKLGAQFAEGGMSRGEAEAGLRGVAPLMQHQFGWIDFFIPSFRAMWAFFFFAALYVYAILIVVGLHYFRMLRRELLSVNGTSSPADKKRLRRAWRLAALTSACVALIGVAFTVDSAFLATNPRAALPSSLTLQMEVLGALYAFALVGTPACFFSLIKSLQSLPPERRKHLPFLETTLGTSTTPHAPPPTRQLPQSSNSAIQHASISVEQTVLEEKEGEEGEEKVYTEVFTEDSEKSRARGSEEGSGAGRRRGSRQIKLGEQDE